MERPAGHIGQVEALHTILDLSASFAGTADLQKILDRMADRITRAMGMKACGLRLLDEDTGELTITASYNLSDRYLNKGPVLLKENPIDAAAMRGETVHVADAYNDPRVRYPDQARSEGIVSALCAPMTYRGKTVGVIRVYSDEPRRFTEDESAILRSAGSQVAAAVLQARSMAERHETERYLHQIRYAGEIQRRMIPARPPVHPWMDFGAVYRPSLEVGGDFYDFVELSNGAMGFAIADVVGKGIPGALIMASIRAALRAQASIIQDVRTIVARVNRHLCHDSQVGEFATVFYGVFAAREHTLDYVSAGHDPALLLRKGDFRELSAGGMVIGVLPEAGFEHEVVALQSGDVIVFYTDGVIDTVDFDGRSFGRERLRQSIYKRRKEPPAALANQILWDTRRFAGLAAQVDDISIVVGRVR